MRQAFPDSTRAQFAGHETFPLRLLWLKKAYDAVAGGADLRTFQEPSAIARFGVGRNMAQSMSYWARAAGMIEESDRQLRPTPLGDLLLADDGLDPYVEHAATIWLAHWAVASTPRLTTTAYFAFNAFQALEFDPAALVRDLGAVVAAREWRASPTTLKRDVEVLLRSYVRRSEGNLEDAAEPLMAELGLIREARAGGWFEFVRGPKPSLPDAVFAYALREFWAEAAGGATTLSAEQICYLPGSPGRVFKLDEDSVALRLMALEALTGGAWRWTDTAGLRQVQRTSDIEPLKLLKAAYRRRSLAKAAA